MRLLLTRSRWLTIRRQVERDKQIVGIILQLAANCVRFFTQRPSVATCKRSKLASALIVAAFKRKHLAGNIS